MVAAEEFHDSGTARCGIAGQCSAAEVSSLGDLPLVVLSRDHQAAPYSDWQRDLAQLSSRGRQLLASDSGHWTHLDRPELVTQAIREVAASARNTAQMESLTFQQ